MHNITDEQAKDKILRNCFTVYLASAVQHRRADFLKQLEKENRIQEEFERKYFPQDFDIEKAVNR